MYNKLVAFHCRLQKVWENTHKELHYIDENWKIKIYRANAHKYECMASMNSGVFNKVSERSKT